MRSPVRLIVALLAALCVALAFAVPAQAAAPKKGGTYEGDGPNVVKVAANGAKVKQFFFQTSLSQCSPMPVKTGGVKPKIEDGTFSWSGELTNVIGEKATYSIKGTFKTTRKLVVVVTEASCHTPKRSFTLRLQ